MKLSSFLIISILFVLVGCSSEPTVIGEWKVVKFGEGGNQDLDSNPGIRFEEEGVCWFTEDGREDDEGSWEMSEDQSSMMISIEGMPVDFEVAEFTTTSLVLEHELVGGMSLEKL